MTNRRETMTLCLAGLFVALTIVTTRLLAYQSPDGLFRISPQFAVVGLSAWLLGPGWGMAIAVVADMLGMAIFPSPFPILPLITVAHGVRGLIFGIFLYRKKPWHVRNYAAIFTSWVIVDLVIMSYALTAISPNGFLPILCTRIVPTTITMTITMILLTLLMISLNKPVSAMLRLEDDWLEV